MKPKTIHPLRVIESLKAQNEALALLFATISNVAEMAKSVDDPARLKDWIARIAEKAEMAQAVLWPEE
jgi:hypothetical protein